MHLHFLKMNSIHSLKLLLLIQSLLFSAVKTQCPSDDVADSFNEQNIPRDLEIQAPSNLIEVTYLEDIEVCLGNQISPLEATTAPDTTWNGRQRKCYTLVFIDPDSSPLKNFIHWLVVNIKGDDVSSGSALASYFPPTPPPGPAHRYTFLVFQQSHAIEDPATKLALQIPANRYGFNLTKFREDNDLGDQPTNGNFFLAQTL